ncbi:MAG: hypothetical protein AAGE59_26520 [Cyanobacteria bacterium P01_F01_bin.86]
MIDRSVKIESKDFSEEPYCHIAKKEFLDKAYFQELNEQWPDQEFFKGIVYGMGGRRGFGNHKVPGYDYFQKLMDTSPAWRHLYESVNNAEFVENLLKTLKPFADARGSRLNFDDLEFVDLHPSVREEQAADNQVFVDFNITEAKHGYWREPHHDNPNKIAVFLMYMNDLDTGVDAGGEFLIYGHKEQKEYPRYERFPAYDDVNLSQIIRPVANQFVGTLNSRDAYHAVRKITAEGVTRRFIYVALGLKKDVHVWKINRPDPSVKPSEPDISQAELSEFGYTF